MHTTQIPWEILQGLLLCMASMCEMLQTEGVSNFLGYEHPKFRLLRFFAAAPLRLAGLAIKVSKNIHTQALLNVAALAIPVRTAINHVSIHVHFFMMYNLTCDPCCDVRLCNALCSWPVQGDKQRYGLQALGTQCMPTCSANPYF